MRISPLLLVVALAASLPAHAVESYIGVGVTQEPDGDQPGFDGDVDTDPYSRVFGGVWINENFAIEAAYHDFGSAKFDGVADLGFDLESDGWSLGVVYEY